MRLPAVRAGNLQGCGGRWRGNPAAGQAVTSSRIRTSLTAGNVVMPTEGGGQLHAERSPMDSDHSALMTKTRELIAITRREILQLRDEIQSARETIDQSQRLLSRSGPTAQSVPVSSQSP